MAPILNLKFKGNKSFVAFSNLSDVDALTKTWKVCTKVASYLEQGQRLENLSWRLWHLQNLIVDTDNAKSKREFKKLSKNMGDRLDREKGRNISELSAPDFKHSHSTDLIQQRAAERERERAEAALDDASSAGGPPGLGGAKRTIKRMQFTFSVNDEQHHVNTRNGDTAQPMHVDKPDLKPSAEFSVGKRGKGASTASNSKHATSATVTTTNPQAHTTITGVNDQMEVSDEAQLTLTQRGRKSSSSSTSSTANTSNVHNLSNASHANRNTAPTPTTTIRFPPLFSSDFGPAALLYTDFVSSSSSAHPYRSDSNDRNESHSRSGSTQITDDSSNTRHSPYSAFNILRPTIELPLDELLRGMDGMDDLEFQGSLELGESDHGMNSGMDVMNDFVLGGERSWRPWSPAFLSTINQNERNERNERNEEKSNDNNNAAQTNTSNISPSLTTKTKPTMSNSTPLFSTTSLVPPTNHSTSNSVSNNHNNVHNFHGEDVEMHCLDHPPSYDHPSSFEHHSYDPLNASSFNPSSFEYDLNSTEPIQIPITTVSGNSLHALNSFAFGPGSNSFGSENGENAESGENADSGRQSVGRMMTPFEENFIGSGQQQLSRHNRHHFRASHASEEDSSVDIDLDSDEDSDSNSSESVELMTSTTMTTLSSNQPSLPLGASSASALKKKLSGIKLTLNPKKSLASLRRSTTPRPSGGRTNSTSTSTKFSVARPYSRPIARATPRPSASSSSARPSIRQTPRPSGRPSARGNIRGTSTRPSLTVRTSSGVSTRSSLPSATAPPSSLVSSISSSSFSGPGSFSGSGSSGSGGSFSGGGSGFMSAMNNFDSTPVSAFKVEDEGQGE
ncbi:hypothetical protein J3R30DRAFT_2362869 [Lentinula aciculospora]|uniref:Nitrogen regulatory protein areA GATA-like domain-containing protein n=1 Tax=Lentinula aciculospora TaxID=153920 RepID=A0A9W9AFK7_9AGAR|nr:hypothetical protein J3R30DRAFT_2362869 [Lentinula aciculospora]